MVEGDAERNLLLVQGAVPGPAGGLVFVRNAVKCGGRSAVTHAEAHDEDRRQAPTPARSTSPTTIFGIEPNVAVMHQVVTAQLAAKRAGTHSTKTRAEVRGGGAKPWRQKGTGRARQGSIRSPQWRGGGVAHGPKPRDYSQRTPKKMVQLALRSRAVRPRRRRARSLVVDDWGIDEPKTKDGARAARALGLRTHGRARRRACCSCSFRERRGGVEVVPQPR